MRRGLRLKCTPGYWQGWGSSSFNPLQGLCRLSSFVLRIREIPRVGRHINPSRAGLFREPGARFAHSRWSVAKLSPWAVCQTFRAARTSHRLHREQKRAGGRMEEFFQFHSPQTNCVTRTLVTGRKRSGRVAILFPHPRPWRTSRLQSRYLLAPSGPMPRWRQWPHQWRCLLS